MPPYCVEHGHGPGPCPLRAPPAPLAQDAAGPSNWAGPMAMDVVEPAPPRPTPSLTVLDLRRRRSRSPPTIAARRSAPTRLPPHTRGEASSSRTIDVPELAAPPPPPQPAAVLRRRVHTGDAANRRPGLHPTWLRVPHGASARSLPNGHTGPSRERGGAGSSSDEGGGRAPSPA